MAMKKTGVDKLGRLAASLASKLPAEDGGYERSSAFGPSAASRFLGDWAVVEHELDGRPWMDRYPADRLGGAEFLDPDYEASFSFGDRVCVKRVAVRGALALGAGDGLDGEEGGPLTAYEYRMTVALEWSPASQDRIRAKPVLGYQFTSLDGAIAAVREFGGGGGSMLIHARFEGEDLVLEDGGDRKVLRRRA